MNLHPIWDNFFSRKGDETILGLLEEIPLFSTLSRSELIRLERVMHLRHYKKDEPVFMEGEPGASLYVVKSGEIAIYKDYESERIALATLKEGMFFGEMALFSESPRSATAVAQDRCELLALSKPDLEIFSEQNPKTGITILTTLGEIISDRLRLANEQIEILRTAPHD